GVLCGFFFASLAVQDFPKALPPGTRPVSPKNGETRTGHPHRSAYRLRQVGGIRTPPDRRRVSPYHAVTVSRVTYCSMVTPAAAVSSWCCTPSTGDHAG